MKLDTMYAYVSYEAADSPGSIATALTSDACGSWIVDPANEVIVGIFVAASQNQALAWMLPAAPIFASIAKYWSTDLKRMNITPSTEQRDITKMTYPLRAGVVDTTTSSLRCKFS